MADQEHLAWLKQDVAAWTWWRQNHPKIQPDLSFVNLYGTDLHGAEATARAHPTAVGGLFDIEEPGAGAARQATRQTSDADGHTLVPGDWAVWLTGLWGPIKAVVTDLSGTDRAVCADAGGRFSPLFQEKRLAVAAAVISCPDRVDSILQRERSEA